MDGVPDQITGAGQGFDSSEVTALSHAETIFPLAGLGNRVGFLIDGGVFDSNRCCYDVFPCHSYLLGVVVNCSTKIELFKLDYLT